MTGVMEKSIDGGHPGFESGTKHFGFNFSFSSLEDL